MSWHNLALAQKHAENRVPVIPLSTNVSRVQQVSLGDGFHMSRKSRTGGRWVGHPEGGNSMVMSGRGCGSPSV